mgnify:CR=1 FL=1
MKKSSKIKNIIFLMTLVLLAELVLSLFVGKYPLSFEGLMAGEEQAMRVFMTLRLPRTCMAVLAGFGLGVAGMVYQTVFRNPLASPDIIGVSSGASAGAAAGILFLSGSAAVTVSAFAGALLAVVFALALSNLDKSGKNSTIVLAGIAVHSLAQTALMCLKLTADPERELASIKYWIMGSLNGISVYSIGGKGSFVAPRREVDDGRKEELFKQLDAAVKELLFLGLTKEELIKRVEAQEGGPDHA